MKLFDKPKPPYVGYNMADKLEQDVTLYSIDIITKEFHHIQASLLSVFEFLSDASQINNFYLKGSHLYVIGEW